jgi:hypothetical protein
MKIILESVCCWFLWSSKCFTLYQAVSKWLWFRLVLGTDDWFFIQTGSFYSAVITIWRFTWDSSLIWFILCLFFWLYKWPRHWLIHWSICFRLYLINDWRSLDDVIYGRADWSKWYTMREWMASQMRHYNCHWMLVWNWTSYLICTFLFWERGPLSELVKRELFT